MNKKNKLVRKNWGTFVVLFIGSLAMIFPFVWMFLSSFKTKADVYVYPPQWLPSQWNWDNFEAVFEMIPFLRYYGNSIYTSVMQTLIIIVISVLAAYALTKLRFPGQEVFNMFMLSSMFVPMVVTMIPMYLMVSSMGLADSYSGIILSDQYRLYHYADLQVLHVHPRRPDRCGKAGWLRLFPCPY